MNHALSEPATKAILAQNAKAIRALGKRVIGDIIEIGRLLTEAKQIAGHGNWLPWLDREFGWSGDTAERFMSLHRLQGQIPQVAEFDLPVSGLYMLAAPGTPDEVREAVIARAESGERLSVKDVRNQIGETRKKQAPETADRQPTRKPATKKHHRPALRSRTETPVRPMTRQQALQKLRAQIDAAVATAVIAPMQLIIDVLFDSAADFAERNGNVKMFAQRVRQRIDRMDKVDRPAPAPSRAPAMAPDGDEGLTP